MSRSLDTKYVGDLYEGFGIVVAETRLLDPRFELLPLSRIFSWGEKDEAGAKQLAFALLYDYTQSEEEARRHYNSFFQRYVRSLPLKWSCCGRDVSAELGAIDAQGVLALANAA